MTSRLHSAPTPNSLFSCFPDLPVELRLEIWKLAAIPLLQRSILTRNVRETWKKPPALLHVKKEARCEMEKLFRRVSINIKHSNICVFFPPGEETLVVDPNPRNGRGWLRLCSCVDKSARSSWYSCSCKPRQCAGRKCSEHDMEIIAREEHFLKSLSRAYTEGIKYVLYQPSHDLKWLEMKLGNNLKKCFTYVETITVALTPRDHDARSFCWNP